MEIDVSRDAFLKGLQMVQNIVEQRQTLPILANVLLEADGESIGLTATDLEVGARVLVPAKVVTKGAITLSARKLSEIVKELPSSGLSIKVEDRTWVLLRCEAVVYKLAALAPDDFPAVAPAAVAGLPVDARLLREMVEQTSFAISLDESRYALNGLLFSFSPKEIRLVATDGHRLAVASRAVPGNGEERSGIVPRKAVHELARVLGAGEEVRIALTENQFVLTMPNFLLTARLIEGQFPNYEQVIPKGHSRRLVLSRAALTAALRRVSVLSEERTKPVRLQLSGGTLRVLASTPELGEAEETLPVEDSGEELIINFNSRYLLDALGPIEAGQVLFELKDARSPGILKSVGEEGYLCVIMPMRT
ncbi:MAG: DNA polymerase III subunit beta [Candidatus Methylomirabilia bacterium]